MKSSPNRQGLFAIPSLNRPALFCCAALVLCLSGTAEAAINLWTGARTVQGGAPLVGGIIAGDSKWSSEFDDGGPSNWAVPVPPSDVASVPANDGTADIQFNGVAGLDPYVDQNWHINSLLFGPAATNTFTL